MPAGFLLSRIVLQFNHELRAVCEDLSAAVYTPDGSLWVASDETATVERLSLVGPYTYGNHRQFTLAALMRGGGQGEGGGGGGGGDYAGDYLWVLGSHSTKRKK